MKKYVVIYATFLFVFFVMVSMAFSFPSYSSLCAHLKEVRGWSSSECTGMKMRSGMGEMVSASKSYTKGPKSVNVSVVGGASAMSYWAPFQTQFELNTPEEIVKTVKVKGINIGISYHKRDKSGVVIVPITKGSPSISGVIVFEFSNMELNEALDFSKGFDWEAIKNLFY